MHTYMNSLVFVLRTFCLLYSICEIHASSILLQAQVADILHPSQNYPGFTFVTTLGNCGHADNFPDYDNSTLRYSVYFLIDLIPPSWYSSGWWGANYVCEPKIRLTLYQENTCKNILAVTTASAINPVIAYDTHLAPYSHIMKYTYESIETATPAGMDRTILRAIYRPAFQFIAPNVDLIWTITPSNDDSRQVLPTRVLRE